MPGIIATPTVTDHRKVLDLPFGFVKTLLEAAKTPVWVAERSGRVLLSNEQRPAISWARERAAISAS